MINLRNVKFATCLALLAVASLFMSGTLMAGGGHSIGNGGGSWVCRESNGKIRWLKLVDLFEATDEFGLTLNHYSGSVSEILEQVHNHVYDANRDIFNAISPYLRELNNLESNPPSVVHTQHIVQTIDDSLYRIKPAASECAGGTVNYEQVVNYKDDGYILVESELINSFPNDVRAALVLHEAIYKYRRDTARDTDSVVTRRIVGLLFSKLSPDALRASLEALGEKEIGNLGMKFSLIQPGTFLMGSVSGEPGQLPFIREPQHRVTLTHEFEIQTTTVTQGQYFQVMGANPSLFKKTENCPKTHEERLGIAMCPDNPVDSVSYDEAQAFINKLNKAKMDQYTYRLPTEAEWEYAARGGTTTSYFFGNDFLGKEGHLYAQYGWFESNGGWSTHEVARLKPNSFGLYDMVGNITQWVSDWYDGYDIKPLTDPAGPSSGTWRVARPGGCFDNGLGVVGAWAREGSYARSASRGYAHPDAHLYCMGFRLVRELR